MTAWLKSIFLGNSVNTHDHRKRLRIVYYQYTAYYWILPDLSYFLGQSLQW
jgi:hypothetical protein